MNTMKCLAWMLCASVVVFPAAGWTGTVRTPPKVAEDYVAPARSPGRGTRDLAPEFTRQLLESDASRYLSGWGRSVLEWISGAGEDREPSLHAGAAFGSSQSTPLAPATVRVNDPNLDPLAFSDITTQSETAVAAFGSNVIVAYNDDAEFLRGCWPDCPGLPDGARSLMGYSRSTDGGVSFTDMGIIPPVFSNAYNFGDPGLVVDRRGNFYAAYLGLNLDLPPQDISRIGIQKSADGGSSWAPPAYPPPFAAYSTVDKGFIAIDNSTGTYDGNVYVTWSNFAFQNPNLDFPIVFSRSTDGGATFSAPIQVSVAGSFDQGSEPAVGPAGEIYVAYFQYISYLPPTGPGILVAKSTDGGRTFGHPQFVAPVVPIGFATGDLVGAFRTNSFPRIDVNPSNGEVYVVFNSNPPGPDGSDIFLCRSSDGGATWSSPRRVNDDIGTADQWFPDLAVNRQGELRVFWYDRRRHSDKLGDQFIDLYAAGSDDGGRSFGPNQRIGHANPGSNTGMLAAVGYDPIVSVSYMGDYNDIKVDVTPGGPGLGFYSAWSDCSRLVTTEAGTRSDQDVVFSRLDLAPGLVLATATPGARPAVPSVATRSPVAVAAPVVESLQWTNPAAAPGAIEFTLGSTSTVELDIYDIKGRRVRTLEQSMLPPGRHVRSWDGRDERGQRTAAGIYLATVRAGEKTLAKKLLRVH
jgi:flagellar hook capping protein FlgD